MKKMKRCLTILLLCCLMAQLLAPAAQGQEIGPQGAGPVKGQVYWFDLSAYSISGTLNANLPDQTLHWVPFVYAGEVKAYRLASASDTPEAQLHDLFLSQQPLTEEVTWSALKGKNLIYGLFQNGYTLRCPSGGWAVDDPPTNEWDILRAEGLLESSSWAWAQENSAGKITRRGSPDADGFGTSITTKKEACFRPVLEPAAGLELRAVRLHLGPYTLAGADAVDILCAGDTFTAPPVQGLAEEGAPLQWRAPDGTLYAPGDQVPWCESLTAVDGANPDPDPDPDPDPGPTPGKLSVLQGGTETASVVYGGEVSLTAAFSASGATAADFYADHTSLGRAECRDGTAVLPVTCAGEAWHVGGHTLRAEAAGTGENLDVSLTVTPATPQVALRITTAPAGQAPVPVLQVQGVAGESLSYSAPTFNWYADEAASRSIAPPTQPGVYYVKALLPAQGNYGPAESPLTSFTLTEAALGFTAISLSARERSLREGSTFQLEALYQPGDVKGEVLWSSSDPLTASVSADGLVTAQRKGVTAIVARGEGCAAACVITVLPREAEVERITLNKTAVTLQTTDRIQLQAALEPAGAAGALAWSTSNGAVAAVDQSGRVTAQAEGRAALMAAAGQQTAVCIVTVAPRQVVPTRITLSPETLVLGSGEEKRLSAQTEPAGASGAALRWYSKDEAVAVVEDGVVRGVLAGTTAVWAESESGLQSNACTVTVGRDAAEPTAIALDRTELTLTAGQRAALRADIQPKEAQSALLTWVSGNEEVAVVTPGGIVTALRAGNTLIRAVTPGGLSASCALTVHSDLILPQKVTLDQTALTLEEGQQARLAARVEPEDAQGREIVWESRDETVAVVEDGLVTAVLPGATAIIARTANGRAAVCRVTVAGADTPAPPDEPGKPGETWPTQGLEGFVTRLYRLALGRDPDKAGHADWVRWLKDGTVDAGSCAFGFVFSKEMESKRLENRAFVETMYKMFMDREGEPTGVSFWTNYLEAGHTRQEVFEGFANSREFAGICRGFGLA